MKLGSVRVMGAGVVVMMCVEEVMCDHICSYIDINNVILQLHAYH